ncbi:DUF4130 domain-containing protein [Methanohalophilus sp.]|uniref:DUF4130 domain-containing protein n=1 Tax=Methanohalophilus sp. TaxID=1966352 RepID=UPI00261EED58|nr:DUF4130 domain-containing protein [Methanohalophilus sp.]MDK2892635.1 hypothetical protein [Methanohalophilus sp.]
MIITFFPFVGSVLQASLYIMKYPYAELLYGSNSAEIEMKLCFVKKDDTEKILHAANVCSDQIPELMKKLFSNKWHKFSKADIPPVKYIECVLRHSSVDLAAFVRFLAGCNGNIDALYNKRSREGKRYYTYMREVTKSYHSLCMFARTEVFDNLIISEINPPHSISDLFCKWLGRRNPDLPVAVIQNDIAYIANGEYLGYKHFDVLPASEIESLRSSKRDEKLENLWDMYYCTQMIDNRRNPGLAKKMQPAYTSGISRMAAKDRYRVERGISNTTLFDFTSI